MLRDSRLNILHSTFSRDELKYTKRQELEVCLEVRPEEEPFAIRVDPGEAGDQKKSCRIAASRARKRGGRRQEK